MAYIYKHFIKNTNFIFYIGIAKRKKRINSFADRNKNWHNIVNENEFDYEIIEDNLSWATANEREKYWIKFYGRKDLNEGTLVNMTDGGSGFENLSDASKKKISLKLKNKPKSEEHKNKIKNSLIGRKHSEETKKKIAKGNIGKIVSIHTKEKLSNSIKNYLSNNLPPMSGKTHSEETKQKISNSNKGKHDYLKGLIHSEETKQKMSISKIGNKINLGRIHSEETKQKIKEKRKLQVFSDESKQKMKESRLNYINKNKKL
jgi:hypothetical protein